MRSASIGKNAFQAYTGEARPGSLSHGVTWLNSVFYVQCAPRLVLTATRHGSLESVREHPVLHLVLPPPQQRAKRECGVLRARRTGLVRRVDAVATVARADFAGLHGDPHALLHDRFR